MADKNFALSADQIKPLATRRGACLATDTITVDGRKVGYMYREEPDNAVDSGWRFMAGDETQEYMDDAKNLAFYDVNTIANYDPDIIPLLGSPTGTEFVRDEFTGKFVQIDYPAFGSFLSAGSMQFPTRTSRHSLERSGGLTALGQRNN